MLAAVAGCCILSATGCSSHLVVNNRGEHIVFSGNSHFGADRLATISGLALTRPISQAAPQICAARIAQAYRADGYAFVAVDPKLTDKPPQLEFHIAEGPRTAVSDIAFIGLKAIDPSDLRSVIKSRTRVSIIFRSGRFVQNTFADDVKRVRAQCQELGYLDAEVSGRVNWNRARSRARIEFTVAEGPRYTLSRVAFSGNALFSSEELQDVMPQRIGEPYRPSAQSDIHRLLARLYARIGYPDVARPGGIRIEPIQDPAKHTVVLAVTVREGPQVRIGRIRVRGLTKTRESVVRGYLDFYPGQVATTERFRRSESLLANSGHFDQNVRRPVTIELAPSDEVIRDVIVRVKEGSTANLYLMAGFSSQDGVMGEFSFSEANFDITNWPSSWRDLARGNAFRGGGQRISLLLRSGTKRSNYSFTFMDPALRDGPWSAGFSIYSRSSGHKSFDETRTGGDVTLGRRIAKFIRHSLSLGRENIEVDSVPDAAPAVFHADEGLHSRPFLRYVVSMDRRDNRFRPADGHYVRAELGVAGGDVETVSLDLRARRYWTLVEDSNGHPHVLAVRGRVAVVDSYRDDDHVPVFERYYTGGLSSVRGFEYETIAPSDPFTQDRVGGEGLLAGSVEYSFPVTDDDRFRMLMFSDFGYVSQDASDVLSTWDELRLSVGIGARWTVQMFGNTMIELNLSWPVIKERGDGTETFQFTIGAGSSF